MSHYSFGALSRLVFPSLILVGITSYSGGEPKICQKENRGTVCIFCANFESGKISRCAGI